MSVQENEASTGVSGFPSVDERPMSLQALWPSHDEVVFSLGLGLYLAWVENMFYGARISERDYSPFQLMSAGDLLYYVSIATLLVLLLVFAICGERLDNKIYTRRASIVGTVGMVLSTLLILSTLGGGALEAVCIPIAGVLSALSSGLCLMQWCRLSSKLDYRGIVMTGALGYVVSHLVVTAVQYAGASLRLDTSVVIPMMVCANCIMAAGAGMVFLRCEAAQVEKTDATPIAWSEEAEPLLPIVVRISVALVVIGFVPVFVRGIGLAYVKAFMQTPGFWYAELFLITFLIVTAVSLLIVLSFLSERARRLVSRWYRFAVLLAVLGSLCFPLPFLFQNPDLTVVTIWTSAAFNCLHTMMWIVTASFGHAHKNLSTRYFAIVRIGWTIGPLVGTVACDLLSPFVADPSWFTVVYVFTSLIVLAVFLMYTYVFTERTLAKALDIMPRRARRPFHERCRDIAAAAGLSERESEIMVMFAKGRDAAFIQQELVLSHSTVSSHRQHIYAKLGVHSQQELLDLVSSDKN